jgi:hypothetical protein
MPRRCAFSACRLPAGTHLFRRAWPRSPWLARAPGVKRSCVYAPLGAKARNKQCESWRGGPRMTVLATSGRRSDHASGPDAAKATGPGIPTMISCRRAGTPLRQLVGLNASADIRTPRATAPPPLPKALRGPRDRSERRVLRLARLSACGSRRVCSRHKNSAPRGSGRRLRHPARAAARSP